jgi:hypothetical protein
MEPSVEGLLQNLSNGKGEGTASEPDHVVFSFHPVPFVKGVLTPRALRDEGGGFLYVV